MPFLVVEALEETRVVDMVKVIVYRHAIVSLLSGSFREENVGDGKVVDLKLSEDWGMALTNKLINYTKIASYLLSTNKGGNFKLSI